MRDYRVYQLSKRERTFFIVVGYGAIFIVSMLFYRSVILSFTCGFSVIFLQGQLKEVLRERRQREMVIEFRDFLYSMSSSVSTGRQLEESLVEASVNLKGIYGENSHMAVEIDYMVRELRENRCEGRELMVDFARRTGISDVENFVDVYITMERTGGNMGEVIDRSVEIIVDKMAIEREIKTMVSQKLFEGKIITAMPVGVVLGLNLLYPDYLAVMYETIAGRIVMTVCIGGISMAYYLTRVYTKLII